MNKNDEITIEWAFSTVGAYIDLLKNMSSMKELRKALMIVLKMAKYTNSFDKSLSQLHSDINAM